VVSLIKFIYYNLLFWKLHNVNASPVNVKHRCFVFKYLKLLLPGVWWLLRMEGWAVSNYQNIIFALIACLSDYIATFVNFIDFILLDGTVTVKCLRESGRDILARKDWRIAAVASNCDLVEIWTWDYANMKLERQPTTQLRYSVSPSEVQTNLNPIGLCIYFWNIHSFNSLKLKIKYYIRARYQQKIF
jgi:hypothetical protein